MKLEKTRKEVLKASEVFPGNKEELLGWLDSWRDFCGESCIKDDCVRDIEGCEPAYNQIVALIKKPEITEEWIEEKAKKLINKSFKDYETEIQAILFVDPIRKSSYRKINKATDALVDQIWDSIHSLVKEIN